MNSFYEEQIIFHTNIINVHTTHINNLKKLITPEKKEYYINNLNHELMDKQIADISKDIPYIYADEQDMIRERITNAHIKNNKIPLNNNMNPNESINLPLNNSNESINLPLNNSNESINPPVNKFSKYSSSKKLEIMAGIFKTAKLNINKLALLDNSINDNLSDHIQKEADRLLNIHLSKN